MTKAQARQIIDSMGLPPDQAAAARRTIRRATTSEEIDVTLAASGELVVTRSRAGHVGRQVLEDTIARDGTKRVVQKAFAFQDRQDALRRPQRTKHGGCRYGVRRSDDRAEPDRRCPWHRGDECVDDDGDGRGRESDRENDEARYRRPIVLEIPKRSVVSRIEQYRCDEQRQRKLGRDGERGRAWKKREHRAAQREEHRIRRSDAARRGG